MKPPDFIRRLPSYRTHSAGPLSASLLPSYAFGLLMFVAALAVRWLADDSLPPGFPYLTFFPAVVIVAFVGGTWPGMLVALLSGIASWYYFIPPFQSFALTGGAFLALVFYVFIVSVDIFLINMAIGAFVQSERLVQDNEKMAEFQRLLIRELDHRIKNLFAAAASIVKLSARYAETPRQLADDVNDRIMALSRSHGALWRIGQEGDATVEAVARLVLEPYLTEHGDRITISGSSQLLDDRLGQVITLIFHELATNAAKYGALLQPDGTIDISSASGRGGAGLEIEWRERGVALPQGAHDAGFGSELIERLVTSAGGRLQKTFAENGIIATVTFPAL